MPNEKLALLGGKPVVERPLARYSSYGVEEERAAVAVLRTGRLSEFLGTWHPHFYGGPKVREFEEAWKRTFETQHAISVNSATSGLIAAIGAIGVQPGDEVIVSPWTMSATATAILVWNAIPVFADIEPNTFGLDPASVEKRITPRTRAIVVTDIFGHGAELTALLEIAKRHGLTLIEDAAQSPGAKYRGKYVGTVGHIGVFSLNYHKHIHTGEGGMCVTNDSALAERMQLIRNHGESVVEQKGVENLVNIVGFNFRMGEIEAAMGIEQLKKLSKLAAGRMLVGTSLTARLGELEGLKPPEIRNECTHVIYTYAMTLNSKVVGVDRKRLASALFAEGVPAMSLGYQNIHRLPIFQKKIAYGDRGYPWRTETRASEVSYALGTCPIAEDLYDNSMMGLSTCLHEYRDDEIELIAKAFRKVWKNLGALR